ncbi:MAG: hypothetical protein M1814_004339 [Vezdaea aestivalis]|nr:MAG: hypothetical protein M1814_004339 [Vezdaea aestivalis]
MSTSLAAEKAALRLKIKNNLADVTPDEIQTQTSRVLENLFRMECFANAKTLGVYLSMPSGEIITDEIVKKAIRQGKEVFVPYTRRNYKVDDGRPRNIMEMVSLHSESDFASLPVDKMNIRKPRPDSLADRKNPLIDGTLLDMIVVPAVAFDHDHERLGHGQGCYDYFLERCQAEIREVRLRNSGYTVLHKPAIGEKRNPP